MGEAGEPLRVQTLLLDVHLDERPLTPKHTTVEAEWRWGGMGVLREGSRITLPKKRSIGDNRTWA